MRAKFKLLSSEQLIYEDKIFNLKDIVDYYITQNHYRAETAQYFGVSENAFVTILQMLGIKKPKDKTNQNHSRAYAELSDEQKTQRRKAQSLNWQNKSYEEMAKISNNRSKAWENKSDAEMENYKSKLSSSLKDFWHEAPEDFKSQCKANLKSTWNSMDLEKKKTIKKNKQKAWDDKSEEDKIEIRIKRVQAYNNKSQEEKEETLRKRSKAQKEAWRNKSEEDIQNYVTKANNSKKLNKTFNSSKPEIELKEYLEKIFGKNDIEYQYDKDPRYPFLCDFYIKSLDLFLELNLFMTHGNHAFDPNNEKDLNTLKVWEEKAKDHPLYKNAIEVWTIKDPKKLQIAKENNLNYLTIYNYKQLNNLFLGNYIIKENKIKFL